jgi:hypothetical protein
MGTRTHAITDHQVPDYRNRDRVVSLLSNSLPAIRAVSDYWRVVQPSGTETNENWSAYLIQSPTEDDFLRYDGPGGFSVRFGERVAVVHARCRWRGFLSIEPLRRIHLTAFCSIARLLGATRTVFTHDQGITDDLVPAAIYAGITQDECIDMIQGAYDAPKPSVEEIAPEVVAESQQKVPSVWYVKVLNES